MYMTNKSYLKISLIIFIYIIIFVSIICGIIYIIIEGVPSIKSANFTEQFYGEYSLQSENTISVITTSNEALTFILEDTITIDKTNSLDANKFAQSYTKYSLFNDNNGNLIISIPLKLIVKNKDNDILNTEIFLFKLNNNHLENINGNLIELPEYISYSQNEFNQNIVYSKN